MEISVIDVTNCISEVNMSGLCVLLLILLSILVFTAGYKWRLIRKREKRIEELENQAIEKEELLKILNIKLN